MGTAPATSSSSLPSGTVSFLFTDIEGSTQRWDRDREAMQDAVRRHDGLMRAAIERHGGHVFKTIGDAFCAAFSSPVAAVAAAIDAQRALAAENFDAVDGLRVRMALHAGSADERNGDYFGPTLNRVARLLGVANGGQMLVSAIVAQMVDGELPAGSRLDDLGRIRLKDLSVAETVFQLHAAGLRSAFPPLYSLDVTPNNLPDRLATFIGRKREVEELRALLASSRLVTIVGTGGVGKTQTALQVAAESLDGFPDGVWFVELATLTSDAIVPEALRVLGLTESSKRSALDVLAGFLEYRTALVVLDNCEHVLEAVAPVVEALLTRCPKVRILATSREGLRLRGESLYHLPPLSDEESVALFVERATAADSRFALSPETEPIVADICRRVDGVALAIELAAARVRLLPLPQLAQRLDDRLRLLSGGRRTDQPRQQTVFALIDWSYQLLSPDEQRWFRQLSIFGAGWSVAGAAAVCGEPGQDEFDALEAISSLVEKSLVVANVETERYRLLESLRFFGRQKLVEAGEAQAVAARHAAWVVDFYERKSAEENERAHAPWRAELESEFEEVRPAFRWTLDEGNDPALGGRLAAATGKAWLYFAPFEGVRRIAAARTSSDSMPPPITAQLLAHEARLSLRTSKWKDALSRSRAAVDAFREIDDPPGLADARRQYASCLVLLGEFAEGENEANAAMLALRELGMKRAANSCLQTLAVARDETGDFEGAKRYFEEAIAFATAAGYEHDVGDFADNYSVTLQRAERFEEAIAANDIAVAARRKLSDRNTLCITLNNRADYLIALRRFDEARVAALEADERAKEIGWLNQRAQANYHLSQCALGNGDAAESARLFGRALVFYEPEDAAALDEPFAKHRAALEAELGPEAVAAIFAAVGAELRPAGPRVP